jgi:hypothetical protein
MFASRRLAGVTMSVDLDMVKAEVAERHGWRRIESPRQRFLATDESGHILWLKARTWDGNSPSWDWPNPDIAFDALIGILVASDGVLRVVVRVPYSMVQELKHITQASDRLRWNAGTRGHPGVEILYLAD